MTTKPSAAEASDEAKYRPLIDAGLRELKQLQKEIRKNRAESERLRACSARTLKDTWEVLRRVEANL